VIRRLPRTIALAVIIGIGIFNLYQAVIGWTLSDAGAYWNAAMRLREGADLYPALASVDASEVYRYAPWFAWLAVPWTFLPVQLAGALWSAVLLAASALALWPLASARAWVLVAFFAPILVGISAVGNVQPLIVAALMHGIERRSGPVWVALAASLKLFPILFAVVWLGRRQVGRVGWAVVLAALLWLPAPLFYDLSAYPTDAGQAASLFGVFPLYVVVVGALVGATIALSRSRFAWLSAGTAVAVALPRLFVYDVTFLMPGAIDAAVRSLRTDAPGAAGQATRTSDLRP
jgi:hypothetical protein